MPSWFPLSNSPARGPALNFIGAGHRRVLLVCFSARRISSRRLLSHGGAKLLHPELRLQPRSLWSVVFVLSGACLAHLLPWSLLDLEKLNIAGPGGWVRKWLGEFVAATILGIVGSIIFLVLILREPLHDRRIRCRRPPSPAHRSSGARKCCLGGARRRAAATPA
jgi:S-DNA-T family DNA segregation ATPase FtsK/SpoIIIE